jgi:1,2-diacylglycerol 3-alpha-glucosyltransferase
MDIQPYRVAMVAACPFPANHGSPASIREMSQMLAAMGHEVHIVTYPNRQDIPVNGVQIHRVARLGSAKKVRVGPFWQRPIWDLLMILKLCRVIRRHRIQIVHAHNYEGALVGYAARLFTGAPVLYNAVNLMGDELAGYGFIRPRILAAWLAHLLDHWVPAWADFVTMVSDKLKPVLRKTGFPEDRMFVVPAGVNPEMVRGGDPSWFKKRFRTGSRPVVIYTGTLNHFQRIDYLLKAMKTVTAQEPVAVLAICPNLHEPELRRGHEAMVSELGISEQVIWVEDVMLDDLPHLLASADVAVLCRPASPGHPVKLLNYMAAGNAIVAFEGSAIGLHHMFNGYLAADHDWEELAQGILTLIKDRSLADRLGANASVSVEGVFDWSTLARGISVIYDKILHDTANPAAPSDPAPVYRHLKRGYQPVTAERRTRSARISFPDRRGATRRTRNSRIAFLDRRKYHYR